MSNRKFFSGNTLDQAVMKAASHFEIAPDELEYRQIEKKHGFLRVRRSVVIEVDGDAPRRAIPDGEALTEAPAPGPAIEEPVMASPTVPEAAEAATRDETGERAEKRRDDRETAPESGMVALPAPSRTRERLPEASGATADATRQALDELLSLAGAEMEYSIHEGDERLEVELWGADESLILRNHGRPLLAMQHLVPRIVRGLTGEFAFCRIDCDSFHMIREERLRDLAQRVASEVTERGRSRMLESMAPDERRIVHMTLADDPNVTTESQGSGFLKRIKVLPV